MNADSEWTRRTAWAEQLVDEITHSLRHLICPKCHVRFGIDPTEMRFVEQTESTVWCTRGHELTLRFQSQGDGS